MSKEESKTVHEAFAKFFENPTRESLRVLLKHHVGELRHCDFKESWPDHSALSKHLLGLGNTGGGCLIIGVRENEDGTTDPVGLPHVTDKADITNGIKNFLPPTLLDAIEIADFQYKASEYGVLVGKTFQVLFVQTRPASLPFVSTRASSHIRKAAIYVRREGLTEEASSEEIQKLIDERIDATPSSAEARNLKEHLEELKVLYMQIPRRTRDSNPPYGLAADIARFANFLQPTKANPQYPSEDFDDFVCRVIQEKKALIQKMLGVCE